MINFIVCEDNKIILQKNVDIINKTMFNNNLNYRVYQFTSYTNDLKKIIKENQDIKIYILDIELDNISGIDIARQIRENDSKSILISVIPILVLVFVQILISYITLKSDKIRNIIDGKPTVIIKNGKLNFTEMSKIRYSLDDLLTQLRLQGVKSIDKVKYAILENNGNLSVFNDNSDYPLPLILDGVIDYEVLKEINKDYEWIINILKRKNLDLNEVFYAFYTEGKTFIIRKDEVL